MRSAAFAVALAVVIVPGRVVDTTTGQPLANVSVDVYVGTAASGKPLRHLVTGADGRFVLRGLTRGTYDLGLSSDDVPRSERVIRIDPAHPHALEFRACSTTLDYSCVRPTVPADSNANG